MTDSALQPVASSAVRKPRKSRGRGLRAATGCMTCRRRRVKCDESRPQCGPCSKGNRECVYHAPSSGPEFSAHPRNGDGLGSVSSEPETRRTHEPLQALADACYDAQSTSQTPIGNPLDSVSPIVARPHLHEPRFDVPQSLAASPQYAEYGVSPGTDTSNISVREPLSWFELLVEDATNAHGRSYFSPPQRLRPELAPVNPAGSQSQLILPRNAREKESFEAAAFQNHANNGPIQRGFIPSTERPDPALPDDETSWNIQEPIQLTVQEHHLFRHFVLYLSTWLDLFDPFTHFSTVVPRLAMRNMGLMKALFALSSRHLSLWDSRTDTGAIRPDHYGDNLSTEAGTSGPQIKQETAAEYYYETLHYLQKAMHYQSYTRSQELLATTLLISTYEMIDGSNQGWERHLKGVFWIQRSQDNHGESGGLKQAVWWAWLRQDLFAAFRERRRVFSFWRAKKPLSTLNSYEMVNRAVFLLSQAVNYCSKEESDVEDIRNRIARGNELMRFLHEWRQYLPPEFEPLPATCGEGIYPPIWVHPPAFACALQMHSLAKILVVLQRPSVGGLYDYRNNLKIINESVAMICGITRTIGDNDSASSLIASQCLFGGKSPFYIYKVVIWMIAYFVSIAGLSVQSPNERATLLELLAECERRTRWPIKSLKLDLESEWRTLDQTGGIQSR
ncbi:hypothetical protein FQN54_004749 [Arachnomyces sp. PD_36]|nr:hypothetical protein FQN54_004749 [Arachnomyces sp. PD_36]